MQLYRGVEGVIVERQGQYFPLGQSWDALIAAGDVAAIAREATRGRAIGFDPMQARAPIVNQEVWAAGVTYYRSRDARIRESKAGGGGDFYARVYGASRPELFFKATGRRVVGPGAEVRIRSDSRWSVAEPELTLLLSPCGKTIGYTIGNDMSSRDIEGENPLYLPQAKVYEGSCALGPGVLLSEQPLPKTTKIAITIGRNGRCAYAGSTTLSELKRDPAELVSFLFRDNSFPQGVFLMTGTGIVPGDEFTLHGGDEIRITIEGIGALINHVA